MPQEVRYLMFSRQELCDAVMNLMASRGDRRTIVGPKVDLCGEDGMPSVTLFYSDLQSTERRSMLFHEHDLLSAAILYCREHRVQLPLKGQKRLEIMHERLALIVSMNLSAQSRSP